MTEFWAFQARDVVNFLILILTAWAVFYGPIRAVQVARREEAVAARARQKAEIFASLMKTRQFRLDPEHVAALNLIQVFFADVPDVLSAYKHYIRLLYRRAQSGVDANNLEKERDDALIELVSEIARASGYPQDKREIDQLSYSPEGWANDNATIKKLHSLLVELLEQKRALPITPIIPTNSPFPPRPDQ